MSRYVIKRLLITIPVLLGVIFIVFTIMALMPADPGRTILGQLAAQEDVDMLNHQLGYDRPFFVRFFTYLKDILRLDFGNSYRSQEPVMKELLPRFSFTLRLALLSIALSSIIGISLGILSAIKQYSVIDQFSTILAMVFAAVPGFWFGMMLIFIFALKLNILPSSGIESWKSYVLPTVTLTVGTSASLMRFTRTQMLETVRQDYIRTARAKGVDERVVIWKHALRNALMPIVTVLGMQFGGLIGGALVCETVFAIPGVGTYLVNAIYAKDIPAVLTSVLFIAFLFCIIMMLVDIVYAFIDPRIKARYTR